MSNPPALRDFPAAVKPFLDEHRLAAIVAVDARIRWRDDPCPLTGIALVGALNRLADAATQAARAVDAYLEERAS